MRSIFTETHSDQEGQKVFVATRQLVLNYTKPFLFQCHVKSWSIKPGADYRVSGSPRQEYTDHN